MIITRKTIEHPSDGGTVSKISFTDGPFAGIIFSYGRVRFIEEADQLRIKFEYHVHSTVDASTFNEADFKAELAEHLYELLDHGLFTNSLIYTGGSDEPESKNT